MPLSLATIAFGPWHWAAFVGFMLLASAVDLGLGRRGKAMSTKSALMWCAVWISLALSFNGWLAYHDLKKGEEFFQGYLLEYSLSVDNLFVFVLVFGYFKTPSHLQHRALVWGIIGAMILRASMILVGAALIKQWQWVLVLFGLFLVYSGIKMLFHDDDEDPSQSKMIQFLQRRLPLSDGYHEDKFLVRVPAEAAAKEGSEGGALEKTRLVFTRLFLVVLVIEVSDVIFAVDSVPAIFGVTKDPFVVFTSNMFAILGLRSLFFALSGAIQHLKYLNYGLSIVLCFIGLKMCAAEGPTLIGAICGWIGQDLPAWVPTQLDKAGQLVPHGYHMKTWHSLAVICTLLGITVAISLIFRPKTEDDESDSLTTSSSSHDLPVVAGGADEDEDAPLSSSSAAPSSAPKAAEEPSDEATQQSSQT